MPLSEFTFTVSNEGLKNCYDIIDEMIREFGVSREEAVLRLNNHWGTMDIQDEAFGYLLSVEFAQRIYYGPNTRWWKKDKSDLAPRPLRKE
jgi:hypothetical protein